MSRRYLIVKGKNIWGGRLCQSSFNSIRTSCKCVLMDAMTNHNLIDFVVDFLYILVVTLAILMENECRSNQANGTKCS